MYSIGQVSEMFGLPISTLRYYDKQGLFPALCHAAGCGKTSVSGADHNGIIFWHQYLLLNLW